MLCVQFALHMFQNFSWINSLDFLVLLSPKSVLNTFHETVSEKCCRYHLSLKMPLWGKGYLSLFTTWLLWEKRTPGESRNYCCAEIHAHRAFWILYAYHEGISISYRLIWGWNGLEVHYGTNFCCPITCFQPNMVNVTAFPSIWNQQ